MTACAPSPRAPAPRRSPRQVLAQAAMEARLMLRNGEQLLLAVVIPVIVLVGGVTGAGHVGLDLAHRPVDVFTPGVLALAVMSTAFTSLAIATGFERRYGVIKRLGVLAAAPVGPAAGKVGALLLVEVLQIAGDLAGRRSLLGWDPPPALAVLGACWPFVARHRRLRRRSGCFVAGVLRAEATLAAANLVYLLLLAGGAVVLPASAYGAFGARRAAGCPPVRSATRCGTRSSTAPSPGATCWCCSAGPSSAPS